jgi:hypothetical protein
LSDRLLGRNNGGGRSRVLNTCGKCHSPDTMQSYVRQFPPAQSVTPPIAVSTRDDEELRARIWKKDRYEWGLLQGLTLVPSKE